MLTDDARYEALAARDPRFDGVFFVGVQTTGIYCRPICPARTPGRARCVFFAIPAHAEQAGFRACFRCRPELAPGIAIGEGPASVDAVGALVATATRRIAEGALNEGSLDVLATELGVSARHLRRATEAMLGVSPVELAQSRRLGLAKQLLQDTGLPLTEIAYAAGFGSVRRFNAVFAARMGRAPSALRRAHGGVPAPGITLRLDYRAPYDWARLLAFLRERAVPGVEHVGDDHYRRIVHIGGHTGELEVRPTERAALQLTLSPDLLPVVMPVVAAVRRMFDLDAHPERIARTLGRDRVLAAMVAARPGLRLPGAIDPFEAAVRALLGQQVSVAAATTLAGRFAARFGTRVVATDGPTESGAGLPLPAGPSYRFPTAAEVALAGAARIVKIGLPMTRATAIATLARAVAAGDVRLDRPCALEPFVAGLVELPGIGPWTAHYLAMRALHLPDAFPAADLGVQKMLARITRGAKTARAAEVRAEAWRPYRSYAVMHLWTTLTEGAPRGASRGPRGDS